MEPSDVSSITYGKRTPRARSPGICSRQTLRSSSSSNGGIPFSPPMLGSRKAGATTGMSRSSTTRATNGPSISKRSGTAKTTRGASVTCSRHAQHADDVLAAAARAGVVREPFLERLEQRADLGLLHFEVRQDSGGGSVDDLAVRGEELLELLPQVHTHGEVSVSVAFRKDAGARNLKRLRRPVAAREVDEDRREVDHRAGEAHDAHEEVAAGLRDPRELGHRLVRSVDDVAEGAAEADRDVERVVVEKRQVGDVPDDCLDIGYAGPEQIELPRRDVERGHVRAEAQQFECEAARAGAGIENSVAGPDVALEHPDVGGQARPRRAAVLEPCPLALTVVVEELRRAGGIPGAHNRSRIAFSTFATTVFAGS